MIEHKLLISFTVFCIKLVDFCASDNLYSVLWRKLRAEFRHEILGMKQ